MRSKGLYKFATLVFVVLLFQQRPLLKHKRQSTIIVSSSPEASIPLSPAPSTSNSYPLSSNSGRDKEIVIPDHWRPEVEMWINACQIVHGMR